MATCVSNICKCRSAIPLRMLLCLGKIQCDQKPENLSAAHVQKHITYSAHFLKTRTIKQKDYKQFPHTIFNS